MTGPEFPKRLQQVGLSKRIRALLHERGIMNKIDDCARDLLPEQASGLSGEWSAELG